jgi:hypothetical protein
LDGLFAEFAAAVIVAVVVAAKKNHAKFPALFSLMFSML